MLVIFKPAVVERAEPPTHDRGRATDTHFDVLHAVL